MRVALAITFVALLAACRSEAKGPCAEKTADGRYVLQRVDPRGADDERTRKIVENHNQLILLICGR